MDVPEVARKIASPVSRSHRWWARVRARRGSWGPLAMFGLFVAGVSWANAEGESPREDPVTRSTMERVSRALVALLPFAVSDRIDPSQADPDVITPAVDALVDAAADLSRHAPPGDTPFSFLSASLAADARGMELRVEQGRYADVAYRVVRMTQTCVACHSQLPSDDGSQRASLGFAEIDSADWSPRQRAQLFVATGRFERALDEYEALLLDPVAKPLELEASGALAEYLMIALRVRQDPGRAQRTLERFSARGDLAEGLERLVPRWSRAISQLEPVLLDEAPTLDAARRVLERGAALKDAPDDREDLVHRIVASSLLYRFIASDAKASAARAEALLLLGESDAFIRRSFERSEARFYLEQAIRLQPGSAIAREAYRRLEEETLLLYTGSSGNNVPPDVQRDLDILRALSRGDRPPARPPAGAARDRNPVGN